MKYFVGLFIWILTASGFPTATEQSGSAQASKPHPADIRINHDVHIEDQSLLSIFFDVLNGTGLHGGFVEMAGCSRDPPKGRLQIDRGATVRQAMDALVAAKPDYQWELRDGAVNLMPRSGVPLLNTRIAQFEMDATGLTIEAVLQELLRLPEVRERQAALGLESGTHVGPGGGGLEINPVPRPPVPVHVNLQNLSLQDAFNKVAGISPDGGWIYRENDCNGARTFIVYAKLDDADAAAAKKASTELQAPAQKDPVPRRYLVTRLPTLISGR